MNIENEVNSKLNEVIVEFIQYCINKFNLHDRESTVINHILNQYKIEFTSEKIYVRNKLCAAKINIEKRLITVNKTLFFNQIIYAIIHEFFHAIDYHYKISFREKKNENFSDMEQKINRMERLAYINSNIFYVHLLNYNILKPNYKFMNTNPVSIKDYPTI